MEVSLFEPRIPQNTGNIARTCAAFDITLNLIGPLGFKLDDKYLKRAGLDYWPLVKVKNYSNYKIFKASKQNKRVISFSKKDGIYLNEYKFYKEDILLFGREDTGLPKDIIKDCDSLVTIFMPKLDTNNNDKKGVRSLNLSVACGIAIYEANKQILLENTNKDKS